MLYHDKNSSHRIAIFAFSEAITLTLLAITAIIIEPGLIGPMIVSIIFICISAYTLYYFRRSQYAEWIVYGNLFIITLVLAAANTSGDAFSGMGWVSFQFCTPLAALIIRRRRAPIIVASFTALIFVVSTLMVLLHIIPMEILLPIPKLLMGFIMQLIVLASLTTMITFISTGEQRAIQEAIHAQNQALSTSTQLASQVQLMQNVIMEKDTLTQELTHSLTQLQSQREQIITQQRVISNLAMPVIPIIDGVVVLPVSGFIEEHYLHALQSTLLQGIQRYQARIAILDITAVALIDTAVAQTLVQAVRASQLIGTTCIVVGIQPEVAQTMVQLGIDFNQIVTKADLQQGFGTAMQILAQRKSSVLSRSVQMDSR